MKISEAAALHPITELAKKPYGERRIRNYYGGHITLRWNPQLAKYGKFEMLVGGKKVLLDAEEFRAVSRVF